jgi:NTE family protein
VAWLAVCLTAVLTSGCAAPVRRPLTVTAASPSAAPTQAARTAPAGRPLIGVAFGGGSARGLAHVGVIRWLEEHRVPIDVAAGTSMGGLIGGSYASGMDADELARMVAAIDWDQMFGSSSFAFKNIRRKTDARAFPSRLEFGLKGGIVPPTALDTGQQVEFLLGQIAAPYYDLRHFDDLPTPFRAVAVDLMSATQIVLESGSLAQAMRATMSLPLIFPPVELDGRVLVDGGVMNNVPADVARAMGADRVIAINVGDLTDREGVAYSLLGLSGATLDAVMRASTKRSIASADIIVDVPLSSFGSLDWRRSADLITEGYKAAEAMRDQLLPFAVSADEYDRWSKDRQSRRRRTLPVPAFVTVDGFGADDARRLNAILPRHVGVPLVVEEIERDLDILTGLDRYETITWRLVTNEFGDSGLLVQGRAKPYAPPFMMLGVNLENTTSNDFRITMTARYLAYGAVTSGSELRIDGTLGSNPAAGVELYLPIRSTPLFVAPYAGVSTSTFNAIADDAVFARYESTFWRAGANIGVNLGTQSDLRVGAYVGHIDAEVSVGDPGLPSLSGGEKAAEAIWRLNSQDSPVIPSTGTMARVRLFHVLDYPDVRFGDESIVFRSVTQFSGNTNRFWSFGERNRVFLLGEFGTSFEGTPLPPDKFSVGTPMRLGSYRPGELLGDHYYVGTGGYFRQLGRLPDFIGGPIFAGAWLENGDAFNDWSDATWRTNAGFGIVLDTLIGPALLAGSGGFDGRWRTYIGIGRIFR